MALDGIRQILFLWGECSVFLGWIQITGILIHLSKHERAAVFFFGFSFSYDRHNNLIFNQ